MAKRNGTGIWIVVASVVVLGFVGVLFLNEGSEMTSDIQPDMPVAEALQITEDSCMAAAGQWRDISTAGNDDSGIPAAVRASEDCDRSATAVLDGASPRVWANEHCRAVVEGWREVARWQIEQGPKVYNIDTSQPASLDLANQAERGLTLMATVQYRRRMCAQEGVVG